jgi:hypothetical protein
VTSIGLPPIAPLAILHRLYSMSDKTHLLCLKPPRLGFQHVIASSVEIHGEHLAMLDSDGGLVALFLMDDVQSWNVLPNAESYD